jgi:hypothetical protein
MGGSNVKALQEDVLDEPGVASQSIADPDERDDVVDIQMDNVVSKLQYKSLATKVDVTGAIGREGDVIMLSPEVCALNKEEEEEGCIFLLLTLKRSRIQEYPLPSYIASEVEAKVPSQMLVSVVKELGDSVSNSSDAISDSSAGLKEDDTRGSALTITPVPPPHPPGAAAASPAVRRHKPAAQSTPRAHGGREGDRESTVLPVKKDGFSMQSFLEKYANNTNTTAPAAAAERNIVTHTFTATPFKKQEHKEDNDQSPIHVPDSLRTNRSPSPPPLTDPPTTAASPGVGGGSAGRRSTHFVSSRRHTKADRVSAKLQSQDDALIRGLLKLHAEAVGLPVKGVDSDVDSDGVSGDELGDGGDCVLYLSDDSSTNEELYQKSLLKLSPVSSGALSSNQASGRKQGGGGEKERLSFRLMNDDDFDSEDDDEEEESDEEEEEEEEESDEEEEGSEEEGSVGGGAIESGMSMGMKDLLQFSCSLVDVDEFAPPPASSTRPPTGLKRGRLRGPHNTNEGSVGLSDDEDDAENYNKRVGKSERLRMQATIAMSLRPGLA